jgi:chemosensory pili system protein ChpC
MARQMNGRRKTAKKKVLRKSGKTPEIHCMLIPTNPEILLLPTSTMAEVIDFSPPEPMDATPPWLLGQVEWESRQVPIFSFSALINGTDVGEVPAKSKIMILKSLSDSARVPYLGLLLGDLPQPVIVKENKLVETGDEKKALGVYSRITIDENEAIIPDLDRVTHLVTHATFGALPITKLDN